MTSKVPVPHNEPVKDYAPGSPERASLKAKLDAMAGDRIEIPMVIGGADVTTGETFESVMPHATKSVLADVHKGSGSHVEAAIRSAQKAHPEWASLPWEDRAAVFLRAAELLAGPWRDTINASTMLGQSKTVHQAEIDAACELIDFWRFNVAFAERIYSEQPAASAGVWNQLDYRPLEGFVLAVTPFNFTSIAGNLPTAPALMGNTVVWKPALTQAFSAHYLMKLFEAAGMPDGVINMVQGPGPEIGEAAVKHADLAGIHFTGSTATFEWMWRKVGEHVSDYRNFPRLVGETGGKDFILAHPSADVSAVATALLRGAFEYQGQKCSAASRVYVPSNLWPALREQIADEVPRIKMGDVTDFSNFMGAVIDDAAFGQHKAALDEAKASSDLEVIAGGTADDSIGHFIEPTVVRSDDPKARLMREELFGPIVTVYVYPEKDFDAALELVDTSTPYGLTGAVFAQDTYAIEQAKTRLRWSAGNFYVNDKPTGAVVGQQPFGGARRSGTNDKAGSMWNLIRWASPRTIKETFAPPTDYRYPFMAPDQDDRP
ncbi:MAG: 1-pyrroline-5-carboxylate dehydrogenase [Actinomycetota bacterium]|jgi:1-pyrroline-5-carboxylate dehydrogenase|nr:1-pyrroline-5-carboxylate dehydrogenase [Actinomycetota bacterium]